MKSQIANSKLSDKGELSYNWAHNHMPALSRIIEKAKEEHPLANRKIGVCLHITKETAALIMGLKTLGAQVYLCGANPLSTQDDIAAYLDSQEITVYGWRDQNTSEYIDSINNVLNSKTEIIMDDGSDVHALVHSEKKFLELKIIGGTEETTTGVTRIMALEKSGLLRYPIIAVNNAKTKHLFDNRYGTGQSTFDGLLRSTSLLIAGKTIVVCGYGWVGKGLATRAKGLGAKVIVTEINPINGLEAHADGFQVMPIIKAAEQGDIFITATGQKGVIRGEHINKMKNGAILSNAGHFDIEIDTKYLNLNKKNIIEVRPHVEQYNMKNSKMVYLIGKGRIANLVAAEGHPPEVMMMSFSNQLLSAIYISETSHKLDKKVYSVPEEIDNSVAQNSLESTGINIDNLTKEQIEYEKSWK